MGKIILAVMFLITATVGTVMGLSIRTMTVENRLPDYRYPERFDHQVGSVNAAAAEELDHILNAGAKHAPLEEVWLRGQRTDANLPRALADAINREGWSRVDSRSHGHHHVVTAVVTGAMADDLRRLPEMTLAERQYWLDRQAERSRKDHLRAMLQHPENGAAGTPGTIANLVATMLPNAGVEVAAARRQTADDLVALRIVMPPPLAPVGPWTGNVLHIREASLAALVLSCIAAFVLLVIWSIAAACLWDNWREERMRHERRRRLEREESNQGATT